MRHNKLGLERRDAQSSAWAEYLFIKNRCIDHLGLGSIVRFFLYLNTVSKKSWKS